MNQRPVSSRVSRTRTQFYPQRIYSSLTVIAAVNIPERPHRLIFILITGIHLARCCAAQVDVTVQASGTNVRETTKKKTEKTSEGKEEGKNRFVPAPA